MHYVGSTVTKFRVNLYKSRFKLCGKGREISISFLCLNTTIKKLTNQHAITTMQYHQTHNSTRQCTGCRRYIKTLLGLDS